MIAEIGHFSLIFALCVACVQAIVPLVGASKGNAAWRVVGDKASLLQFVFITIAFASLIYCHVSDDFSVINVVANSHTEKPLLYKIAGVWGNHEGSMLLWVFILSLYGLSVALFGKQLPPDFKARALSIQAMISVGFLLFILLTSNPFLRIYPPPANGEGLNPLLQDPGLAFHPPFLYLGYVGFSMAFSFAIAALIEGRMDATWARWVRPWILAAWVFLTFGIAMGSWWAYYTLGWGGWWYWDPVENASFMPWLIGTALIHSSIVVEKRDTLKAWTVLLTIFAFLLSLVGTFMVRSGILTSVHSFASDPGRGLFILLLLGIITVSSLILFAWRAPTFKSTSFFMPFSRESALLLNNALLCVAAGTVFLGTLYPLFIDALGLGKISVGPPFFNSIFIPLAFLLLTLMTIGPLLTWKKGSIPNILPIVQISYALAFVFMVFLWLRSGASLHNLLPALALGLAAAILLTCFLEWKEKVLLGRISLAKSLQRAQKLPRSNYGMTLAHMGVAILIIGITASSTWKSEKIQIMQLGDTVHVASYDIKLDQVEKDIKGPNYISTRATFGVYKKGERIAALFPERRLFLVPASMTTDAAIHPTFGGDIYAVIGDAAPGGGYITRLYFNPLVAWIFIGAGLIACGGLLSLSDKRYRAIPLSAKPVG